MASTVRKAAPKRGAGKAAAKAPAKKPAAKNAATKKAPAKKAPAKSKPAAKRPAAKKAVAKKAVAKKSAQRNAANGARASRGITPAQALANTRKLLEAKQAHDRETPPWQAALDGGAPAPAQAGFQDAQAREQANDLHAAESRMEGIHGASGTQARHNQGKRDKR